MWYCQVDGACGTNADPKCATAGGAVDAAGGVAATIVAVAVAAVLALC